MKKSRIIAAILTVLLIVILALGIYRLYNVILVNELSSGQDVAGLRWAILGAMGSWAGSVFGAIALVISIIALWQPQRIRIQVSVSTAMMMSQLPGVGNLESYDVTVKNVGLRPVTISNVYLNFGCKKHSNIFVGMLNQGSLLQPFTITFPKRLEPLYICVAEVVKGQQYYKTKWTLKNFIGNK